MQARELFDSLFPNQKKVTIGMIYELQPVWVEPVSGWGSSSEDEEAAEEAAAAVAVEAAAAATKAKAAVAARGSRSRRQP